LGRRGRPPVASPHPRPAPLLVVAAPALGRRSLRRAGAGGACGRCPVV